MKVNTQDNLRESQFRKFTFNNSIHIDVIVYSKENNKLPTIEAIKRFSLRFTGILGLFSPEPRSPEFLKFMVEGKTLYVSQWLKQMNMNNSLI